MISLYEMALQKGNLTTTTNQRFRYRRELLKPRAVTVELNHENYSNNINNNGGTFHNDAYIFVEKFSW